MNPLIENLFDHLGDGVIVIAEDQRVKFSNRAAQDLMNALPAPDSTIRSLPQPCMRLQGVGFGFRLNCQQTLIH